jgi:PPM family protein phosphatase
MTFLRVAAETHTGYVRSTNQDLALVSGDLVAVADGMGGHLGGEVAARTAIEELLESYLRERTADGLVTAARRANRAVWRKSRVDRKLHGMGTTLTAAALIAGDAETGVAAGQSVTATETADSTVAAATATVATTTATVGSAGSADTSASERAEVAPGGNEEGDRDQRARLILVNVGDSRAYMLDRNTHALRQLTEDHSVVEEMVRQGELTPEEAAVHPHRHVLTRALGIEAEVVLDIWDLEAEVGSRYLLCSDGLTNEVADEEIADILAKAADPEQAARELVGRALGHGGMDNVTVVVADVVEGDADRETAPELVPPRPPRPEAPVVGTPDLTEAIPISRPPGTPEVALPPSETAAAPGEGEAPATGGATSESAAEELAPGGASDPAATAAGAAGVVGALARDGGTTELAATPATGTPRRKGRSMTVRQAPTPPAIDGVIDAGGLSRAGPGTGTYGSGMGEADRGSSGSYGSFGGGVSGSHTRPVVLVRHKRDKAPRDRIVTFRVAVFVILVAGLLAGTAGTVIWFDQTSYFVGLHGSSVAIYEGRPGGMLWFKPQLIETSQITTSELLATTIVTLRGGIAESSLTACEQLAARLKDEKAKAFAATTTTSTTTTSTSSTTTTSTFPPPTFPPPTAPPATQPYTTQPPTTQPPTTQPPQTTVPTTQPVTTTTVKKHHHKGH